MINNRKKLSEAETTSKLQGYVILLQCFSTPWLFESCLIPEDSNSLEPFLAEAAYPLIWTSEVVSAFSELSVMLSEHYFYCLVPNPPLLRFRPFCYTYSYPSHWQSTKVSIGLLHSLSTLIPGGLPLHFSICYHLKWMKYLHGHHF